MSAAILIPLAVLGSLLVLLLVTALLSRVQGGRYLRPVAMLFARVGFIRRAMQKASLNQLERTNPELASAMRKLQTFGEPTSPEAAQRALRVLTPAERKAYLEAAGEQAAEQPEAPNRQLRRRMEHGGAGMPMRPSAPAPVRPGTAGRRSKKKKS